MSSSLFFSWISDNHDLIEVGVWAAGLLALLFAGGQLSESRKQRGLSESFTLSEKINDSMSAWCAAMESSESSETDTRRALAEVLTVFEIISDGINRGYLSRMSREILTHQIIGCLNSLYSNDATKEAHCFVCDSPGICSAFRIFLLDHHKIFSRSDKEFRAFDVIFSATDRTLLGNRILSMLERRIKVVRLMLHSS